MFTQRLSLMEAGLEKADLAGGSPAAPTAGRAGAEVPAPLPAVTPLRPVGLEENEDVAAAEPGPGTLSRRPEELPLSHTSGLGGWRRAGGTPRPRPPSFPHRRFPQVRSGEPAA